MAHTAGTRRWWLQRWPDLAHFAFTTSAMAALKGDASVVMWGEPESGGDSSAARASLLVDTGRISGGIYMYISGTEG